MKTYRNVLRSTLTVTVILLMAQPLLTLAYQAAPVANTKNPTFITEKAATMNGSVNPNEVPDTYAWFEWGISGRPCGLPSSFFHIRPLDVAIYVRSRFSQDRVGAAT